MLDIKLHDILAIGHAVRAIQNQTCIKCAIQSGDIKNL